MSAVSKPIPAVSESLFASAESTMPGAGLGSYSLAKDIRLIYSHGAGSRMLDGQFTAVQQAMGARLDCPAGAEFLASFVEETKASGFVEELIQKHGVEGRLSVAPPAA